MSNGERSGGAAGAGEIPARGLARMRARSRDDSHRPATPLELLFDLAFVVAFGQAADQLTHLVVDGHVAAAVTAFIVAIVAIASVWVSFSVFTSAFGTDDWAYRGLTMVQMIGVVVLALGLPDMFRSFEHGGDVSVGVLVSGYIVMRAATLVQWLRLAAQDHPRRASAIAHAALTAASQLCWLALAIVAPPVPAFCALAAVLFAVEILGPVLIEQTTGPLPWHADHIAERFGLLAIIALGEGVFGTVASVSALVTRSGWSSDAVMVVVTGIGLTFGLWWMYFMVPHGWVLNRVRSKFPTFTLLHLGLWSGIVATGAGLHIAALTIEGEGSIGIFGATLSVIIPVGGFCTLLLISYAYMQETFDWLHALLSVITTLVLASAVLLTARGATIVVTFPLAMAAPAVSVIGWEIAGWRHQLAALTRLRTQR